LSGFEMKVCVLCDVYDNLKNKYFNG